ARPEVLRRARHPAWFTAKCAREFSVVSRPRGMGGGTGAGSTAGSGPLPIRCERRLVTRIARPLSVQHFAAEQTPLCKRFSGRSSFTERGVVMWPSVVIFLSKGLSHQRPVSRRASRVPPRRRCLNLEALEDRSLPSTLLGPLYPGNSLLAG